MTPRTDAEAVEVDFLPTAKHPGTGFGMAVTVEFARGLERELDALKVENIGYGYAIQTLRRQCGLDSESVDCSEIAKHIDELQARALRPNAGTQRPGASDAPIANQSAPPGSLE